MAEELKAVLDPYQQSVLDNLVKQQLHRLDAEKLNAQVGHHVEVFI